MKQSNKTNAVLSVMLSVGMCTTAMGAVAASAPQQAYASPASSSTAKAAQKPTNPPAVKPATPSATPSVQTPAASPAQVPGAASGAKSAATHLVTAAHDTEANTHEDKQIDFKDPILKARLLSVMKAKKLIKENATDITTAEALKLTEANLERPNSSNDRINNLSGMEHFTNLTNLNLSGNYFSNILPLQGLTKLQKLNLRVNSITNI